MGINVNVPNQINQNTPLHTVRSGATAESDYSVKYVPQDLTEAQKAQARQNIGAAEEGGGGQQVQANWNETDTTSPAYIQNKPTIPAAPVQSNWNESDTASLAYIQNKPNIPNFPAVTNPVMFDNKTIEMFFTRRNSASLSAKYDWFWSSNLYVTSADHTELEQIDLETVCHAYIHTGEFAAMNLDIYNDNEVWMWQSDRAAQPIYSQINFNSNGKFNVVYTNNYELYYTLYNTSNTNHPEQCWTWWLSNTGGYELVSNVGNLVLADAEMNDLNLFEDPTSVTSLIQFDIYVPKSRLIEFEVRMKQVVGTSNYEDYVEPKVHTYDFITQNGLQLKMITLPTIPLTMTDALGTVIDGDFVAQNVTITPAV